MTVTQEIAQLRREVAELKQPAPPVFRPEIRQALDAALEHIRTHKDIVVGTAAPTHVAAEPTLFWDKTNDLFYINSGGANWTLIGGAGISAHVILDGSTHTDSAASTIARGDLIVANSTPKYDGLTVGAAARILQSDGTDPSYVAVSGDATIAAGGAVTVAGTHSGSAHHAEAHTAASHSDQGATGAELETLTDTSDADALHAHSNHGVTHGSDGSDHDIIDHATDPQFSDVFSFVGSTDSVTISSGTFDLPAAPFGLITITGESDTDDDLDDILTNGSSTTLVPGTTILLTNFAGDAITVKHSANIVLNLGVDVILDNNGIDWIVLYALTNGIWVEHDRSPSLMPVASPTVSGFVEIAAAAEINTATATGLAMSPGTFSDSLYGIRYVSVLIFAPGTDTATGDDKAYFHIPPGLNGMDLMYVHAEVFTAGTTNTLDIQLAKNGSTDMLSTVLTVDSAETGSDTAATPAVIKSDGSEAVATNDTIVVDIDAVHTTAAKGLVCTLGFRIP